MSGSVTLAAALLPPTAVFLFLQSTRWDRGGQPIPPTLIVALAVGIGLGVGSCAFFVALVAFGGAPTGVIAVDLVLVVLSIAVARYGITPRPERVAQRPSRLERALGVAVVLAALAGAAAFAANTLAGPHGEWDAWAIWNLRARWLFRAGADWSTAFSTQTIHGDYPLLLPGAVARLWVYGGADTPVVPAALAAVYAATLVLFLYGALAALRDRAQGLLGALCLLGTPLFLRSAAWQYADIPLAFSLLATLALLAARDCDPVCGPTALVWAGVAAGLAAWTKNEGLLLLLCLAAVRGVPAVARPRQARGPLAWFLAGLAPFAAVVLYFKLRLAPPTYLLAEQHSDTLLARLADGSRYGTIARAAGAEVASAGAVLLVALAIYIALTGRTRDRRARRAAINVALVLAGMALGYGGVYLITPADLAWQLSHSLDRLVLQLWPSALFAFFLYAASPEELVASLAAGTTGERSAVHAGSARRPLRRHGRSARGPLLFSSRPGRRVGCATSRVLPW